MADLYRAICDNPDAHDPRLMFADEAKDSDDECLRAWGDFIVLQFEREKIGEPRYKVETGAIHSRGGPDYFQFDVGEGSKIAAGDRVDVSTYKPGTWKKNAPKGEFKSVKHGLKVVRVESADFGGLLTVTAKEDAESVPWPKERAAELDAQITEKFRPNWIKWIDYPRPLKDIPVYYHNAVTNSPVLIGACKHWEAVFRLGFFSDVTVANFDLWCDLAPLRDFLPINAVTVRAWPSPVTAFEAGFMIFYLADGGRGLKIGRMSRELWLTLAPPDVANVTQLQVRAICEANWPKVRHWKFEPR